MGIKIAGFANRRQAKTQKPGQPGFCV